MYTNLPFFMNGQLYLIQLIFEHILSGKQAQKMILTDKKANNG